MFWFFFPLVKAKDKLLEFNTGYFKFCNNISFKTVQHILNIKC